MSDREIMDAKNGIESRKSYGFRDPVVRHVVDKFVERSDIGFEKLKTMNYQISEAFNKLMETIQKNNSITTEDNKNKKD